MTKKTGMVAYVAMAIFLVAFVACGSDTEATPESPIAAPTTQPAEPTIPPAEPTVEPTAPVVQPTPNIPAPVPTEPTETVEAELQKVSGTVTYLQKIGLSPNAVVIVSLLDVSRADAPSVTLGEQLIENPGQVPVSFEIEYDPDEIDDRFSYAVRAEIREDDRLLFTTTSTYPVITRGNPNQVDLVLEQVVLQVPIPSEFTFEYVFANDTEGWSTGFADLPVGWTQDLYELESEYRQLPDELLGGGIYMQGHNRSDDLFMYVMRQVSGLAPDSEYQVEFSIDLATNVPGGMMGIGGSPGESVFVKGGATANEPVASDDGKGLLMLNVDKGFQINGGSEMVMVGNIMHPEVVGEEFKIKTLDNAANPLTATTDENGQLWLIAGTDSGFEGLTGIYYAGIRFHLTVIE